MSKLVLKALQPTRSGAVILVAALFTFRQQLQRSSWSRLAFFFLLFLNRSNLPFRWHLKLLGIALRARARHDLARLGWLKPTADQKALGLKGDEVGLMGVGKNVFEAYTIRKSRVSFAESDYNLHLSNSNYAQSGDFARMQWASDYFGVIAVQDGIHAMLGGTSFVYFREIPMFSSYQTETRVAGFDDRWVYALTRFIIPYDARSKRAPAKSLLDGSDCTICAFLLSRVTYKRGRVGTTPERALALAGMVGPGTLEEDRANNWRLAQDLRKRREVPRWMQETEGNGQFLKGCEERNKKALEIVGRLHEADRQAWLDLDALH